MHTSIATISSPQFINLQPLDINPLMSSCEIKVLYVGANRNGSYISKEVATNMAKTLRGAPIVGYYMGSREDFGDHGQRLILDAEGIRTECLTVPYGFVAPDAKVWFQTFDDYDEFGNSVEHEYLMTTGYIWDGQFAEAACVSREGRPQSMELDENTLQGHWSTNIKEEMEFFIINDATITKLCILGNDVEPCFEGASVTMPEISASFTLDDAFRKSLYNMMQDLQFALEGGTSMENLENLENSVDNVVESEFTENEEIVENEISTENEIESTSEETVETDVEESNFTASEEETETPEVEFKDKEDEEKDPKTEDDSEDEAPEKEDEEKDEEKEDEEKKKYSKLESDFSELSTKYADLEARFNSLNSEYAELLSFKKNIDNQAKDAMIAKFFMLSEEDLKDVKENKENYSVDEIESKLATICFRKKISFEQVEEETEEQPNLLYNLDNDIDSTPEWIRAVENAQNIF